MERDAVKKVIDESERELKSNSVRGPCSGGWPCRL